MRAVSLSYSNLRAVSYQAERFCSECIMHSSLPQYFVWLRSGGVVPGAERGDTGMNDPSRKVMVKQLRTLFPFDAAVLAQQAGLTIDDLVVPGYWQIDMEP
jgi:hypothetical protein